MNPDMKNEIDVLYSPSAKAPAIVEVPEMSFLMVDGEGDPDSQVFQDAVQALYGVAYTIKFTLKKSGGPEFKVSPLEGLWWSFQDSFELNLDARDDWKWTVMIMQPEHITSEDVTRAVEEVKRKKNPTGIEKLRFERFAEGLSVQIMHIGPYSEERPTIERMHSFALEQGYELRGKHHEIYLGDPRRAKPEKLKTILRQPVK